EPLRVVPGGAVETLQSPAAEHLGVAANRGERAGGVPAARVAARGELAEVRLRRAQRRRRGLHVERVAVLAEVRDRHRRLEVRRQQRELLSERRAVRIDDRADRARGVEESGVRRADASEGEPWRSLLQRLELLLRLRRRDGRGAARAVDQDE